jgi:hypothetical protein
MARALRNLTYEDVTLFGFHNQQRSLVCLPRIEFATLTSEGKMADCEFLNGCPFFNDKLPMEIGLGALFKKRYCQGDNSECARYMIATTLGRGKVPGDLFPNMLDKAKKLIAAG